MNIQLTNRNLYKNKSVCIKAVRQISGLGLQEAKTAVEMAETGKVFLEVSCNETILLKQSVSYLESNGFTVTIAPNSIFDRLKEITCSAIQENNFQVAEQLITILKGIL